MEKIRKNLKDISAIILILAVFSFLRVILNIVFMDFDGATLPEEATKGLILATQIAMSVVSIVMLLPQIYLGVKGMKVSENSEIPKAAIVWAIILAVFTAIGIFPAVSSLIEPGYLVGDLLALAETVIDTILFIAYVKYAKQLSNAA